jgi:small subunit ribosomal protein S20
LPNIKGSEKRHRQSLTIRTRNRSARGSLRKTCKVVEAAIEQKDQGSATESIKLAIKALDTAARKGLIKKNTAARKKSRLQLKVNRLSAS